MTKESRIREMVAAYSHKSSYGSEPYWKEIGELGADVIPYFIEAYPAAKYWQQRASYLYRSIRHARTSKDALALAVMALEDRSGEVRYRACMLLACSQNARMLPELKRLADHKDQKTRADAKAAIDAIEQENHNYFVDRKHSGKITLNFE